MPLVMGTVPVGQCEQRKVQALAGSIRTTFGKEYEVFWEVGVMR
jgi:hypothetical protein